MSKIYTEQDVLDAIEKSGGDITSEELLEAYFPKVPARIKRAIGNLNKIMEEVKTVFPDANYYLEDTANFHLLLGQSHGKDRNQTAQRELTAHCSSLWGASGGGW